jgi:hypothetical protein
MSSIHGWLPLNPARSTHHLTDPEGGMLLAKPVQAVNKLQGSRLGCFLFPEACLTVLS